MPAKGATAVVDLRQFGLWTFGFVIRRFGSPGDQRIRKPQVSSSNLEVGSRKTAEIEIQPSKRDSPCDSPLQECKGGVVRGAGQADTVEVALADALQRAAAAGEWAIVERLATQIEERRLGRQCVAEPLPTARKT